MSEEAGHLSSSKNNREPQLVSAEAANRNKHEIYEFGPFRLEPAERKLLRGNEVVALTPKVFDMLVMLVRNNGHLLEKDELIRSLWPDSFVEEGNLSNNVFVLRKALGNDHEYIETVPRRGYRFTGAVLQLPPAAPTAISGVFEVPRREVSSNQKLRIPKILFAGMAAALLLFTTVFIVRRFMRASPAPTPNPPLLAIERRLTANPSDVPVNNAVVSPDGKFLAYGDRTGLYLRQISNGETRPWSLPKNFFATPKSWFPDSTHLLVVRIESPSYDGGWDPSRWKPSLYKLSLMGGEPQELKSDAEAGYVSPDGSRVAYLSNLNRTELWIMDSDGSNSQKIVSGDESKKGAVNTDWIYPLAWSPNGKHLAYIQNHSLDAPDPVEPAHSLRIIGRNGDGAAVVLDDTRIGPGLWWAPDGRILFSYREGAGSTQYNYGVYSIRLDERTGKATGPPQPVTQAEGKIGGISGTADGKQLVLWRFNKNDQAFITTFDSEAHKWREPRRLTLDSNENLAEAWTADSKAVLFVSNRNGTWKLFKQAIDETTPEELVEGRSLSLPRLSADGSQVLYFSSPNPDDVSFPVSLMSKPLAGGPPRVVIEGKGIWNEQCAMAPATLCIFSQNEGQDLVFRTFDLQHGAGHELLRMVGSRNWSLSPDGSKLAIFIDPHRIRFFSIATRAAHDVTVKDWVLYAGDWGTSGKTVFMPSNSPTGASVILEVDQTGTAKVVLQGEGAYTDFWGMIQSPDSRYAVLTEYVSTDNNAWIVNEF
jgi:DNA-binding winged helix-turn-helix (wHTH) protein/Tol biopolymer transport system component